MRMLWTDTNPMKFRKPQQTTLDQSIPAGDKMQGITTNAFDKDTHRK